MDFCDLRSEFQDDIDRCHLRSRKTDKELIVEYQIKKKILRNTKTDLILFEGEDDDFDSNLRRGDGSKSLRVASINSDYYIAMALIEAGADPNDRNKYGETALHLVSHYYYCYRNNDYYNHNNLVKALLKAGADPNAQDEDGLTALHLCLTSHRDMVKDLLEAGADPNIQDENGLTALHLACKYDYYRVVKNLLEAGADPNIQDKRGKTALNYAFDFYRRGIVTVLETHIQKTRNET